MGARRPCTPAPPIDSALPLPVEDRPLWAPGGPHPRPAHQRCPPTSCGGRAPVGARRPCGTASGRGPHTGLEPNPHVPQFPGPPDGLLGGSPRDHPSLQISRLRPPDLGVPAFQKPVPAPDSAWAQSPPPSTRSRTPPGPQPHLPDGRGGKHLPFGAHAEDHHGGHHHDEVWGDRATVTSQAAGHQQRGWQSAGQGPTRGRPSPHPRHVSRPPEPPCPALAHRLLRAVDTRLVLSVTRPPPCPVSSI